MDICVIGGAGYVGTRLVQKLLDLGFKVTVIDIFWYWKSIDEYRGNFSDSRNLNIIKTDIREFNAKEFKFEVYEYIIYLACVSNDPSFDLNPNLGREINLIAFQQFIKILIESKSKKTKLIFASSSSVYGVKEEEYVTELIKPEPLTDYSRYKLQCEEIIMENSEFIDWVILRPATVCGWSPRMRFDLVVNILTYNSVVNRKIKVHGGEQFRPNIHIDDMVRIYTILVSDSEKFNKAKNKVFNVGAKNLKLREIANTVSSIIDNDSIIEFENIVDERSYRITSDYIEKTIGFECEKDIQEAISDIKIAFANGKVRPESERYLYNNIQTMNKLISDHRIITE
jgi:nucleoside-diphosphate-sugar epimerase